MSSGNPMLDGILWGGWHWGPTGNTTVINHSAPTVITYYFAHNHEFSSHDTDFSPVEIAAIQNAMQAWANVANIQFVQVTNPNLATFIEHSVDPGFFGDPSVLGQHDTPDSPAPLNGYFNFNGYGWDYQTPNGGLQIGGDCFLPPPPRRRPRPARAPPPPARRRAPPSARGARPPPDRPQQSPPT